MRVKQGQGYRVQTTVEQRNIDGTYTKVDPTTILGTLLLPDQTTQSFTPTKDAVGEYHADLSPTLLAAQTGPYQWKVITTGPGAGEQDGSFDVVDPFETELLSLDDARQHLNLTGTSQDAELEVYLAAVTGAVGGIIGAVGRRTVTETVYPAAGVLELGTKPVLSITSITPYAGVALSSSVYTLRPGGFVYPATYAAGFYAAEYTVVYVAGRAAVPAEVNLAARIVLAHLWETQRGAADTAFGVPEEAGFLPGFGFALPNRAKELLARYQFAPGSA